MEENSMCKVISVVNQKGGVAKSTTTLNLGVGLVRQGKKVLLIDADPQGSLTASLGYAELFEEAFYEKKNLDPKMREETTTQTVDVPDDVDAELLAKVLANPEMKALLASLAKAMK